MRADHLALARTSAKPELDDYRGRRYGPNARSVALTAGAASVIRIGRRLPWLAGVLPMVAPVVARNTRAKRALLSRVARAFVSD